MPNGQSGNGTRTKVAVVGAGIAGLCTAWFLQQRGVEVTVHERTGVAAGASWGNAGYLTPALVAPLPEPAILRFGVRALLDRSSPVFIPPRIDPGLLRFLLGFARSSTRARWQRGTRAYGPLIARALESYDALEKGGVDLAPVRTAPVLALGRTQADLAGLDEELAAIAAATGQSLTTESLTGAEARAVQPGLSSEVGCALMINGQRFAAPGELSRALAGAIGNGGGAVVTGRAVTGVRAGGDGVVLGFGDGSTAAFDAVILATGAWLDDLARSTGVRLRVQAGRGYSFSTPAEEAFSQPLYFPAQRVACTPLGARVRVAGTMELIGPDAPPDGRRIRAIADAVQPYLPGLDLADRDEAWVGSRPCTADGLPLIGATAAPGVYVCGGHGMWGMTLGPVSGRLLAEAVVTGTTPAVLRPFDPLR